MDRRRFVPSTEGLEGRALLSMLGTSNASKASPGIISRRDTSTNLPQTFQEKEQRIDRLPFHLERIQPGRFIDRDAVAQLQTDLRAIAARLHPPGPAALNAFNDRLRDVLSSSSLSVSDARTLNQVFGQVVTAAGATPQQVEDLKRDMNALARVDANSPKPVFLATNDYTLVLQTVLGVGRPIRTPAVPALKAENGQRVNDRLGVTPRPQPTLVGTYDSNTTIQVVDAAGNVYGSAPVKADGPSGANGQSVVNGRYEVTFDRPLASGLHSFHVRAIDAEGHESRPSPAFKLKVITDTRIGANRDPISTPGGPRNLIRG